MLSGPIALFIRSLASCYLTWLDVMKGLEGRGLLRCPLTRDRMCWREMSVMRLSPVADREEGGRAGVPPVLYSVAERGDMEKVGQQLRCTFGRQQRCTFG